MVRWLVVVLQPLPLVVQGTSNSGPSGNSDAMDLDGNNNNNDDNKVLKRMLWTAILTMILIIKKCHSRLIPPERMISRARSASFVALYAPMKTLAWAQ